MTVSDDALPDRSLLLRTLVPVLGLLCPDAVACDITAAYVWGVDAYPHGTRVTRTRLHVAVPRGVRRVATQAVVAHHEPVPPHERVEVEGARITAPARTAADIAARAPSLFLATSRLDMFLSRGLVHRHELVAAARRRRPSGQNARLRAALRLSSGLSHSPAESWARVLVRSTRLPPPEPQCPVPTREGVFHADLGWPRYRLALEYDSREHHADPRARALDRYAAMADEGWGVVPIGIHDLCAQPGRLLRRLQDELTARGWSCSREDAQALRRDVLRFDRHPPRLR
ncbi:hypothetical protein [Nocardiopsis sp. Huas11]|uniref:hypothetical protein n=1 Tax=Nocardiopsis sp. Huas11 TaxID=2183912 RepID=UPI000EB38140|nr:hypothetical protein [Nocardiopsis sp. Huas11]